MMAVDKVIPPAKNIEFDFMKEDLHMKKFLAMLLALTMALSLAACGEKKEEAPAETPAETPAEESTVSDVKIGLISVHDINSGYDAAHIEGLTAACEELGIDVDTQVVFKYNIPEDETCQDTAVDLAEQGCTIIFSDSYGHQMHMQAAAEEYPDVTFVACTGDLAANSGLSNYKNMFPYTYESRYVSGVVAGMKLKELMDAGTVTDPYVGYVGAYPYAEVVCGYTAFLLGIQSIVPEAHMDVQYTNSWYDPSKEAETANALMARGCVIIGQHADSTGAPSACEAALKAGTTVYCVGYNVDMLAVAPTAALTSPTNVWEVFYEYAFNAVMNGESFDTNWSQGYEADAVKLTPLGESCAPGTQEKVDETIAAIKDGSLHVFDTSKFTVGGETVTSAFATDTDGDFTPDADEAIFDGYYHESYFQSAPSFQLRIDGITELN